MRKLLLMLLASVFSLTAFAGAKYLGALQGTYVCGVEEFFGIEDIPGNFEDQLQITAENLPEGLKIDVDYDEWDEEWDIDIYGVVTADPGTYNVKFYKNGQFFKNSTIKVYAMPKITGKYTASSSTLTIGRDLYDEYGNELKEEIEKTEKAKVDVTVEIENGILTKCDYFTESKFWKDSLTLDDRPHQSEDFETWKNFEAWSYAKVDGKEGVVCSLWLDGYPNDGSPYDYYENYVTLFFANSGEVTCFTGYYKARYDGEYSYYILEKNDYPEWGVPLKMTKVTTPGSGTTPDVGASDFTYIAKKDALTITGKTTVGATLVIPEAIGGKTVVAIADGAFSNQSTLTSVTIPDSVTSIGKNAFAGCTSLDVNAIKMPNQPKLKVGKGAFVGCKVTEITAVPGEPKTDTAMGYKVATSVSGFKLNAKSGAWTATFKKPGTYEAVLFKPGENLKVVRIKVGAMPKLNIEMEGEDAGCSVKGAGSYLMGKKVTLSAKASKEKIFLGFYDAQGKQLTSAMKYSYVMGRENVTLTAKFTVEQITINTSALTSKTWQVGETVNVTIPVTAESGVKSLKAAKLPAGLKLAKTKTNQWQVTGSPKKEGSYTVTFTVGTVQKKQKIVTFTMKVEAESVTINTAAVKNKTLNVGQAASGLTIGASATSGIKSVKVSKLPSGMKVQQIDGVWQLTGAPKKAGTYTVTLTITTKANTKVTETFTLTVALVPEWAIGTYFCDSLENGWWCDDCEQMEYAYGDGWIAIDAVGNVRGKMNLWDDSSYTYADIDTKANVKIRGDGACVVKFNINVYTLEDDGDLENEGRFSFEVIVKEAGTLVLDYGDPSEYVQGIFRK